MRHFVKNLLGVKMILTEDCVNGGDRFRNSKYVTSVLLIATGFANCSALQFNVSLINDDDLRIRSDWIRAHFKL